MTGILDVWSEQVVKVKSQVALWRIVEWKNFFTQPLHQITHTTHHRIMHQVQNSHSAQPSQSQWTRKKGLLFILWVIKIINILVTKSWKEQVSASNVALRKIDA